MDTYVPGPKGLILTTGLGKDWGSGSEEGCKFSGVPGQ